VGLDKLREQTHSRAKELVEQRARLSSAAEAAEAARALAAERAGAAVTHETQLLEAVEVLKADIAKTVAATDAATERSEETRVRAELADAQAQAQREGCGGLLVALSAAAEARLDIERRLAAAQESARSALARHEEEHAAQTRELERERARGEELAQASTRDAAARARELAAAQAASDERAAQMRTAIAAAQASTRARVQRAKEAAAHGSELSGRVWQLESQTRRHEEAIAEARAEQVTLREQAAASEEKLREWERRVHAATVDAKVCASLSLPLFCLASPQSFVSNFTSWRSQLCLRRPSNSSSAPRVARTQLLARSSQRPSERMGASPQR
jgi:hypothetical protein